MKYIVTRIQCRLNTGRIISPNNDFIEEKRDFDTMEALEKFREDLKGNLNKALSLFDDWQVEDVFFTYKEVDNEESK